jgi:UDP-N-acetyl-D-glucosamine dehydrogenase
MLTELKKKIYNKNANVGIIGLGYVGLPIYLRILSAGFNVIGFDKNKTVINKLRNKKKIIEHIDLDILNKKKNFSFEHNLKYINKCDIIILCLPTPIDKKKKPELSAILDTNKKITKYLRKGQLYILESTIYTGLLRKIVKEFCLKKNFKLGEDFFGGYSPEREDPGNSKFSIKNIPKLCSGLTVNCKKLVSEFYKTIVKKVYLVDTVEIAETSKLFENTYRSVNIALVNEFKLLCENLNLNVQDILNAAATKPFGFTKFDPGPGVGGHCIPIDPYYLSYISELNGFKSKFIKISADINESMPKKISKKIYQVSKKYNSKSCLLIGIAYKKNVDDLRESPSLEIFNLINSKFKKTDYHDNYFKKLIITRKNKIIKKSVNLSIKNIKNYDLIVLATDHDYLNYKKIYLNAKKIIDLRNKFPKNEKVYKF